MINTKTIVHVVDVRATEAYAEREPIAVRIRRTWRHGTLMMTLQMLKDNELVGAFTLARQEVRLHRQADRVGAELCSPSRYRHREPRGLLLNELYGNGPLTSPSAQPT